MSLSRTLTKTRIVDKVADMVKAKDANADMRCLFDGLDFIPTVVG